MLFPAYEKAVYENKPKMNPLLAGGYTRYAATPEKMIGFLNHFLQGYNRDFPPGLRYTGIEICSSKETLARVTRKSYQKHTLNIHDSDLFMVKANFSYDGRDLKPVYFYLPLIGQGGTIKINGSLYTVVPIPTDVGVSVDTTNNKREPSFRVSKSPIKFHRHMHGMFQDGRLIHTSLIYSHLLNKNAKARTPTEEQRSTDIIKCLPLLAFYIFSEYGFAGTVERYCSTTPKIVTIEELDKLSPEELEVYSVYRSTGIVPKGIKNTISWRVPGFAVLVKKTDVTDLVNHLVGSFFYIVEHYPDRFTIEDFGVPEEVNLWAIVLGKVLWKNAIVEGRLFNEVDAHLGSVRTYLDVISRMSLEDADIYCDNIYDLFIHIMDNEKLYYITKNTADLGQKRLTILSNLLKDITQGFNLAYYSIDKKARNAVIKGSRITSSEIEKSLDEVRYDSIIAINSDSHPEVMIITSPNDSIVTSFSVVMMPQDRANKAKTSKSSSIEAAQLFHPSVLEFGCINNLTDKDLSGRDRLNLYCQVDANGHFIHNPKLTQLIEEVTQAIYG